ncbi:MAG TPA: hypothetical protein VEC99_02435 [Clostridia bacterium]|nr:hypothetical protein [Clostridia bacterium]
MAVKFSRKTKAATIGAVVLLLSLALLLTAPRSVFQIKVSGVQQSSNGVLLVSLILTNGTRHPHEIDDDVDGGPALILDDGATNHPTIGKTWVKPLGNRRRVLAPGAALPHTVCLSNAPPRFRFIVPAEDLVIRNSGSPVYRVLGRVFGPQQVYDWHMQHYAPKPPTSVWINLENLQ